MSKTRLTQADDPVRIFASVLYGLPREFLVPALQIAAETLGLCPETTSIGSLRWHLDSVAQSDESSLKPAILNALGAMQRLFAAKPENNGQNSKNRKDALDRVTTALTNDLGQEYWSELGSVGRLKNWHHDIPDICEIHNCKTLPIVVSRISGHIKFCSGYLDAKEISFPNTLSRYFDPDGQHRIKGETKFCPECKLAESEWMK